MLAGKGLVAGDRVIIYMPMIPEAVIAMLGCARAGVVHSVVFGGFAAAELAKRIDDCTPKMIISASCGHEPTRIVEYKPLLDEAIDIAKHSSTIHGSKVQMEKSGLLSTSKATSTLWVKVLSEAVMRRT